jgi:hypothetical protein
MDIETDFHQPHFLYYVDDTVISPTTAWEYELREKAAVTLMREIKSKLKKEANVGKQIRIKTLHFATKHCINMYRELHHYLTHLSKFQHVSCRILVKHVEYLTSLPE